MLNRRTVLSALGSTAFAGLAARVAAGTAREQTGYGSLQSDPAGILDLPSGFSYDIISRFGDRMDDGFSVPDSADGMGCFALDRRRIALVRNHELAAKQHDKGAFATGGSPDLAYDHIIDGPVLPGGTTTLVYNLVTRQIEQQYLSLVGTIRNCAGGTTPWGSWLTCEEDITRAGSGGVRDHGWVFEVPARSRGLIAPIPLTAMGRFNHEAAAIDPRTGIVYMTEDRPNGLFYRFLPDARGRLAKGGRLQALGFVDASERGDSRNWNGADMTPGASKVTRWIDLDDVEAPDDDLRLRGHRAGAALFARGEGVHFGDNALYFCCTSGGKAKLGQMMRYTPSRFEGDMRERSEPGAIELFVESTDPASFNFGDNLTVAPNGHLIICEDQYTDIVDNHLRGVTPQGAIYTFARLRDQTELAGACFSPDGMTLFVNLYSPGRTVAITGPWGRFGS